MKVFVTGGTGYIGSEFVSQCNELGHNITVFDNLEYGFKDNVPSGVKLIVGDLRDFRSIQQSMIEVKPDIVVHFAAYALVGESMKEPLKYFNNNVTGGINLLMAMEQTGCNRIIFSSSCATYGVPKTIPITEDTPQNPINPYGQSKLMFEQILKTVGQLKGLKYTIFRYFNAAGSDIQNGLVERHVPETHIIPNLIKSIKEDKEFLLYGNDYNTKDGTCIRDYIHIKDIASSHIIAMQNGICGEFNLGTSNGVSNLELVKCAERISGKKVNFKICNRRPGDPDKLVADSHKAMCELGWKPSNSNIDNIIDETYKTL